MMESLASNVLPLVERRATADLIRLRALAESFPSLARRLPQMGPALLPNLGAIAQDEHNGAAVRNAARFVLSVFDSGPPSLPVYFFDMRKALGSWDDKHADAFEVWNAARWWC
jgi:hypothetical protein